MFAKFAAKLMDGDFGDGFGVFKDLFAAMVELQSRRERGMGLQNFQYGATLLEFANIAAIVSPELYRLIGKSLQLPTLRDIK